MRDIVIVASMTVAVYALGSLTLINLAGARPRPWNKRLRILRRTARAGLAYPMVSTIGLLVPLRGLPLRAVLALLGVAGTACTVVGAVLLVSSLYILLFTPEGDPSVQDRA